MLFTSLNPLVLPIHATYPFFLNLKVPRLQKQTSLEFSHSILLVMFLYNYLMEIFIY